MSIKQLLPWLDERYAISGLINVAREKSVPVHKWTVLYYTGGVCLFLFLIQLATGILLLMYYRVGTDSSYESVQFIVSQVKFGWLIRSIHSWGANLLIFFIFVHMFSVLFMKSYRKPRELTWASGIGLLALAMIFGFSGYLLPWNELAFFATKVGTDIAGQLPFIGKLLIKLVRGGEDVTGATLSRFFGLHVAILPAITVSLMGIHLLFVQIQGMSHSEKGERNIPFFPNFVLRDVILWLFVLDVLAVLAVFAPWDVGMKAEALASAPAGIKPEWYFLPMYQMLKILPSRILFIPGELAGIMLINIAGLALALVPFFDINEERGKLVKYAGIFVLVYLVVMAVWGKVS